jgi:hypothetical protein
MRKFAPLVLAVFLIPLLTSCYSTRVSTPKEPNGKKIEKKFATGFLFGLATPGANIHAERCDFGAARVQSKYSFLNMVASNLTFGLYTPMSVEVWCAEQASASTADRVLIPSSDTLRTAHAPR